MFDGSRTSRLRQKIEWALLAFDAFVDSSLNTSLERARDNQTDALYNYNLARVDLAQAMGKVRSMVQ